ncbi:MAG TPA: feruloyl-CoA synthase [Steroidobacteraceae bacterium]|nr:feruloyl-CoA synthase [Steroidobacteraceae bacterium]
MSSPYRPIALGPREVELQQRADGSVLLRSPHALGAYPNKLTDCLVRAGREHGDRVFLAVRASPDAWRTLTYGEALASVRRIAAALLARGLSSERPVAILSAGSIEHALLALAAMHVGIPFAPISPAYSLASADLARLRHVLGLLTPGLVFAQSGAPFARALAHAVGAHAEIVVQEGSVPERHTTPFAELLRGAGSQPVDAASERVGPDTIAKVLFTSGSTGVPKGVINTQRMLCANQQMFFEALPVVAAQPPVLLDWLPWHHTSGGNQILGLTLYHAGTLYIDEGRPLPDAIGATVRNLREIAPTLYFTVPRGYAELIPHLRADRAAARSFFSRVGMFYYSGASLAHAVIEQLDQLAVETCGERIPMLCGYGSTETAPFALCANWLSDRSGLAGLPVPGVELKLAPAGAKFEARVRGPNVMPGYWREPERTRAVFDEEGFLRTGDALSWVEARDPRRGLAFDGRLAEDFKLTTGTWVSTGALRARLMAASTLVQDVVITGEGRDEIGALIFPDIAACRSLCFGAADSSDAIPDAARSEVLVHPRVTGEIQSALDRLASDSTGSSTFIARAMILLEPPSIAAGEMTDKGSINQRAVLTHRASLVEELYAQPLSTRVQLARQRR